MPYPVNAALGPGPNSDGYALRHLQAVGNSESLVLIVSFSGGGYRAAAMAFAVMEVLEETRIDWEGERRTLLQELDSISAVSGGSLAAAFFAQDPDAFVQTFRQRVLDFDLQSALIARIGSPAGFWRQTSADYGRGDLLQEVLDENFFSGLTYADVPRRRPMVSINATTLRFGERFEFTQDQFDHICSDLNSVPLARAVAASMAVPLLMSPVSFWNHREHCSAPPARIPVRGRAAASRYIHLVDGGLADNTGVHAVLETVAANGGLKHTSRVNGFRDFRKMVFLVVNAQVNADQPADQSPHTPGLWRQFQAVVDVPIDRHSDASLQLLTDAMQRWQAELALGKERDSGEEHPAFTVIEINMARSRDAFGGEEVKRIPTSLAITSAQVETIRRFVRRELELSEDWRELMRELGQTESQQSAAGEPTTAAVRRLREH